MTPRWMEWLVRKLAPRDRVEDVLGDLEKVRHRHQARRGRLLGTLLAALETLKLALMLLLHRRRNIMRLESTKSTSAGTAMESVLPWLDSLVRDVRPGVRMVAQ